MSKHPHFQKPQEEYLTPSHCRRCSCGSARGTLRFGAGAKAVLARALTADSGRSLSPWLPLFSSSHREQAQCCGNVA